MVYLLHLERKFYRVQHYVGYTKDAETLELRMKTHRAGRGSRLLKAAANAGIDFVLARVWEEGDLRFERKLKQQRHHPMLCPYCQPGAVTRDRARRARAKARDAYLAAKRALTPAGWGAQS